MSTIPMTSAALPPRVMRPSTAPSQKPIRNTANAATGGSSNYAIPSNNNVAVMAAHHQHTANTVSGLNRSRPSSAIVVSQRPLGTSAVSSSSLNRPSSGAAIRPSTGGTVRSAASSGSHFSYGSNATASAAAQQQQQNQHLSMSNRTSAVASVKGDILLLQRTIDKLLASSSSGSQQQQQNNNYPQRDGLFEIEQILAHEFPPILPGDDSAAADTHAKLLELFVQRLNSGAMQALRLLDPDVADSVSLVSRTAAISALFQQIVNGSTGGKSSAAAAGGENNIMTKLRSSANTTHVHTQTVSIGGLSSTEVTDFQVLLKEQREISSQMKKTLTSGGSSSMQNEIAALTADSSSGGGGIGGRKMTGADRSQLRALKDQLEDYKSQVTSLQNEIGTLQSKLSKSESARVQLSQSINKSDANNKLETEASSSGSGQQQSSSLKGGGRKGSIHHNNNSSVHEDSPKNFNSSGRSPTNFDDSGFQNGSMMNASGASTNNGDFRNNPEAAFAAAMAGSVGFHRLDQEVLSEVGLGAVLEAPGRFVPERHYCEQVASKCSSVVNEILQSIKEDEIANGKNPSSNSNANNQLVMSNIVNLASSVSAKSSKKKEKADSPEALQARIGATWWVLEKQNATVQAMQLLIAKQHDQLKQGQTDHEALDKRSKRMISVLEEKLGHAKSVVQRLMEENEILAAHQSHGSRSQSRNQQQDDDTNAASQSQLSASGTNQSQKSLWGPNIKSTIDDPTPEESRRMYERNEIRLQRRLLELEHENAEKHSYVEQAKLHSTANHREVQMLKTKTASLDKELVTRKESEQKAVKEAQELRGEREGNKRDIRETRIAVTEAQQKVDRLQVELHITQNIVEELRKREVELDESGKNSQKCQQLIKYKMRDERDSHTREMARLREENRAAKHEVIVANQILADERQKALANEREIERLRGLDLQLEQLQQNFANYAGAKQAQKEAHDEEERALQACVELVGQDVFSLPFDDDEDEENVELLLQRLLDAEESMAAEERTRENLRNTVTGFRDERSGRKQLATLMQRRYNAIQIFASRQRLRQMNLEHQLQDALVQNDEHRVQYEGAMVELAHARSHEQALLQRNSELEQQRRENIKTREGAEGDVKSLKQTIQRMRIANEEQEASIVDLGTKLKRKELGTSSGGLSSPPFNNELSQPGSLNSTLKSRFT